MRPMLIENKWVGDDVRKLRFSTTRQMVRDCTADPTMAAEACEALKDLKDVGVILQGFCLLRIRGGTDWAYELVVRVRVDRLILPHNLTEMVRLALYDNFYKDYS